MRKRKKLPLLLLCLCAAAFGTASLSIGATAVARADGPAYEYELPSVSTLTLPSVLDSGMVLQCDQTTKLWGLTAAGAEVTGKLFADGSDEPLQTATATADAKGQFALYLRPVAPSYASYRIEITDGRDTKVLTDVLFGEVWLTGGQSNMELQLQYIESGTRLISEAVSGNDGLDHDKLRMFMEPTMPNDMPLDGDFAYLPQFDIRPAKWTKSNVQNDVKAVSGVGYSFALRLFRELNETVEVPVAVINTAVGATSIEAWMSRGCIDDNEAVGNWIRNEKKNYVSYERWNTTNTERFNQMTAMFNMKIAPIAGYAVKGLLWYQGENNMGDQKSADFYAEALPAMVKDWSLNYWGREQPFYCVFMHINQKEDNYKPDSIPQFLEGLSTAWNNNRSFMMQVPIYDIPLDWNFGAFAYKHPAHPLHKIPVGTRAARIAAGNVYGKYEYSLPATYQSMRVQDGAAYLAFENTAGGLKVKNGAPIRGFTVCGADREFVAANAQIQSDGTVKVWSDEVDAPVAVTYAYTCFNNASNLYNGIDLPVVPFRTDRVASRYYHSKDWLFVDNTEYWRDDGLPAADPDAAGTRAVWVVNPITKHLGTTVRTVSDGLKGGAVSLRYGRGGTFGFGVTGPKNRGGDLNNQIFGQFDRFSALRFHLRNPDGREKSVSVTVQTADGDRYGLVFSDLATVATVRASADWQTYKVQLDCMTDGNGRYVFDTSSVLKNLTAMEFSVTDTQAGSIVIDELSLRIGDKTQQTDVVLDDLSGKKGIYENTPGIVKFADGYATERNVLALGKEGYACATYRVRGVTSVSVRIVAAGGSFAYKTATGLRPFDGDTVDIRKAVPAQIGSDGFKYAFCDGVWYRCIAGANAYLPLTGEGAIFPTVTLPDELFPVATVWVESDGEFKPLQGVLEQAVLCENGYIEERYVFALPAGAERVRVGVTAEKYEQIENGNVGMIQDRARRNMLCGVTGKAAEDGGVIAPDLPPDSGNTEDPPPEKPAGNKKGCGCGGAAGAVAAGSAAVPVLLLAAILPVKRNKQAKEAKR